VLRPTKGDNKSIEGTKQQANGIAICAGSKKKARFRISETPIWVYRPSLPTLRMEDRHKDGEHRAW
jgi:hypothetical protein